MTQTLSGPRFTALHTEIVERIESGEFPSVSIGAIQRGRVLWRESIGLADKEKHRPATPHTPYGLASLGKLITASALMVLVDRMEVNLNAPIAHYIGEESLTLHEGELDQVTVRRVLNMTAAIPHGHMIFNSLERFWTYPIDTVVRNRAQVVFPPGEVYLYSNFAYALLEKLISDVSGMTFDEFLQEELFNPLDMRDSFVSPNKPLELTAPAAPYHQDGSRILPHFALPRNSLSIHTSLNDLLNFARFQLGTGEFITRPFSARTLEKMHDLRGEAPGAIIALGLARTGLDSRRYWLLSNGRAGGMQATLSLVPAEGLGVICLINATGQAADDLAFRITDLLLPGFLNRALKIINKYESWAERPYKPKPELNGDWTGVIEIGESHIPIELSFHERGEILAAIGGGLETPLSGVGYRNGLISGDTTAILPMEEAQYEPHPITLSLRLKDGRLSGFVTAEINNYRGNFSLAAYVYLSRGDPRQRREEEILLGFPGSPEDEPDAFQDVIDVPA
jgi:CubicO group peptidase (beta-lactamase class C family)